MHDLLYLLWLLYPLISFRICIQEVEHRIHWIYKKGLYRSREQKFQPQCPPSREDGMLNPVSVCEASRAYPCPDCEGGRTLKPVAVCEPPP